MFVLAPQLGLTQANLLRWAGEVYKSESAALLREYEAVLPSHGSSRVSTPQGLEASRNLANSVHHYAYALTHSSAVAGGESGSGGAAGARYRTAITARKKVYQLLRRNLVAWKKLKQPAVAAVGTSRAGSNRNTFVSPRSVDVGVGVGVTLTFEDIRQDWPELLKVTCTAGQHLLSISDRAVLSPEERRHVAGEILLMTQEMMGESHPSQHNSILLMVADIHQQIGVMDLQESQHLTDLANTASGGGAAEGDAAVGAGAEGDATVGANGDGNAVVGDLTENNGNPASARELIVSALQHFQLSLDVNTQIAEKTGAHILVSPLILTANALASLEQFDQAFEHYRRAVALNERHLGAQHNSNLPLLVDFGISLVHASHCEEAVSVIDRALELIALNNVPTDSVENRRATLYKQKIAIKCEF